MSDIAIRLDGIVLLGAMALGAILYLVVALIAGLRAVFAGPATRARRVALFATVMGVATTAATLIVGIWWDRNGSAFTGPDWIDQLTWLWGVMFLAGCWVLVRVR